MNFSNPQSSMELQEQPDVFNVPNHMQFHEEISMFMSDEMNVCEPCGGVSIEELLGLVEGEFNMPVPVEFHGGVVSEGQETDGHPGSGSFGEDRNLCGSDEQVMTSENKGAKSYYRTNRNVEPINIFAAPNLRNCFPPKDESMLIIEDRSAQGPTAKKGSRNRWTDEESRLLLELVSEHGAKNWNKIANKMRGRSSKQCRERWIMCLHPSIKKEPWTVEEDLMLINAHMQFGNKWGKISKCIPGRPENSIKNRWNAAKKWKRDSEKSILQDYIASILTDQSPLAPQLHTWNQVTESIFSSEFQPSAPSSNHVIQTDPVPTTSYDTLDISVEDYLT